MASYLFDAIVQSEDRVLNGALAADASLANSQNRQAESLLHQAAALGNMAAIDALLSAGADINHAAWSSTPLDFALWNNEIAAAEHLIHCGAAVSEGTLVLVNRKNEAGAYAALGAPLIDLICGSADGVVRAALNAVLRADRTAVNACVQRQPSLLEPVLHRNRTLLHQAASQGELGIVEDLIKAGAALDSQDDVGRSPLLLAYAYGRIQAQALLIQLGANPLDLPDLRPIAHFSRSHRMGEDVADGASIESLNAHHTPNPCDQFETMIYAKKPAPYAWFYRSVLENHTAEPLRIVWFEHFAAWEDHWYPGNVKGRPLSGLDFTIWYGDSDGNPNWDGWIAPGAAARCEVNWHTSHEPTSGLHKWAYRAAGASGRRHYAEAIMTSVDQLPAD